MTRITGDDFMLIGLQGMAAGRGDGLTPEMIDLLQRSPTGADECPGLLPFPERPVPPHRVDPATFNDNNVIAFPLALRRATRR